MTVDLTQVDAANAALQADPKAAATTKRYANAATAALHAMNPTTPPPPPPVGRTRGVGAIAFGGAQGIAVADLAKLDVVMLDLGGDQAIASKVAPAVPYCYGSAVTVQNRPESLDPATAQANGWLLKDAAGNLLTNGQYGGHILDLWNPATGTALGQFFVGLCRRYGFKGIAGDDVVAWCTTLCNALPAGRSEADWHAAIVLHVGRIGAELRAAGLAWVPNASGFIPGGNPGSENSDNGVNTYNFWGELAPHVSGLSAEAWEQNFANYAVRHETATWDGFWSGWRDLHKLCNAKGIAFYGAPYCNPDDAACMYVRATFLLDYRPGDCLTINPLGTQVYGPKSCADPGAALAPAALNAGTWSRRFANETPAVTP